MMRRDFIVFAAAWAAMSYRSDPDEAAVADRILEQFETFLGLQGPSGSQAVDEVVRIRSALPGDEHLTVEDVLEVLDTYGPKVNLDQYEDRLRRNREALLQRLGGSE